MRWLCDENVPRRLVDILRSRDHDVAWIRELSPGMPDGDVLGLAIRERRVCLTFDKDFGELAAGAPLSPHSGVVLLRVPAPNNDARAAAVVATIEARADWAGHFTVVEPGRIRMRSLP